MFTVSIILLLHASTTVLSSDEMFNPSTITQENNEINRRAVFSLYYILIKSKYLSLLYYYYMCRVYTSEKKIIYSLLKHGKAQVLLYYVAYYIAMCKMQ